MIFAVEKADTREGILQLVVARARPADSADGDRQGEGLDWPSFKRAMGGWVANFGRTIDYFNPATARVEPTYCGIWDTHKCPLPSDLIGAWPFDDEQVYRIQVKPHDATVVAKAEAGRILGASWRGSTRKVKVG